VSGIPIKPGIPKKYSECFTNCLRLSWIHKCR